MKIENNSIRAVDKAYNLSARQEASADFVLPDYFADISKILKCSVSPITEAVSVSGDKISVSGKLQFSLLYMGEDKRLYNFENEIKYTKVFQGQNIEITDSVIASQYVSSLNYRALGPKRIEIKSTVMISAEVISVKERNIVSSVESENVYMQTKTDKYFMPVNTVQRDFTVNETVTDGNSTSTEIQCILRKNKKIRFTEVKPIANKLFVKGDCEITLTYLTEESKVNYFTFVVPFSEVTDVYMLEENDICTLKNIESSIGVAIKDDSENNASFDVTVFVSFTVEAVREKETAFINDIYSSSCNTFPTFDDLNLLTKEETAGKTFNIDFEADTYDTDGEIVDCYVDSVRITVEQSEEKQCFVITGNYNALVEQSGGGYALVSRSFSSEQNPDIDVKGTTCDVKITGFDVLSISALRVGNDKIRFKCDIHIRYSVSEKCKENVLTELKFDENSENKAENKIVLYYGKKDELIWDIAKENRASITLLKSMNSIQGESLSEDKVLLLTNF